MDREAAPIPPSAVISVAQSITTGPSSPDSPCPPIRRQLSHDQGKQIGLVFVNQGFALQNALVEKEMTEI